jgi:hypothetical protein
LNSFQPGCTEPVRDQLTLALSITRTSTLAVYYHPRTDLKTRFATANASFGSWARAKPVKKRGFAWISRAESTELFVRAVKVAATAISGYFRIQRGPR